MSDPVFEIAREARKQTALLANIRSHVRIAAWCVVIWFVFSLPFMLVAVDFLIRYVSLMAKRGTPEVSPQLIEPSLPLSAPARRR